MARARNIKPAFFTNDELAEVEPLERLLFIGLWTIADRAGRLEDRPRKIKAEILPYDDCQIDTMLDHLASKGFIERYAVDTIRYIEVCNFTKHQHPHMKEPESSIPENPNVHMGKCENGASTVQAPDEHGAKTSDPLNPITDTPTPITDTSNTRTREDDQRFDMFWSQYPRKTNKVAARRAWDKAKPDDTLIDTMLRAISVQRLSRQWQNPELIPHASTWLNGERWNDELPAAREAKKTPEEINNEKWAEMAEERGLKPNRAEREGRIQVDDAYETQWSYAE